MYISLLALYNKPKKKKKRSDHVHIYIPWFEVGAKPR
jgi:hypothetical protein